VSPIEINTPKYWYRGSCPRFYHPTVLFGLIIFSCFSFRPRKFGALFFTAVIIIAFKTFVPKSASLCRLRMNNMSLNSHTYLLTYLLRRAESFLRSYLVLQLVKKFPTFYGTRKFITVLTSARHLSISWANSIPSPQPPPTSWISILILSSHLVWVSPVVAFPQVSLHSYTFSYLV
jgi:hypothetical protein